MSNKFLYILLGIVLIGAMGYGVSIPCMQIKPNMEAREQALQKRDRAQANLDLAIRNEKRIRHEQEERKKNIEKNKGKLKEVYEVENMPSYMDVDSLFGKMLHDIINMAKRNGLKVRSMVFYSDIEKEALVMGRDVSITAELESFKKNESENGQPQAQEEEPAEAPIKTDYKAYQVDFNFVGTYTNLNAFIKTIKDYKYLVKVRKMETYPYPENPKILLSNVSLILYAKTK